MNQLIKRRVEALEARLVPSNAIVLRMPNNATKTVSIEAVQHAFDCMAVRAREWNAAGKRFPIPSEHLKDIPELASKILPSVGIVRDSELFGAPDGGKRLIDSIRLLVSQRPNELSSDAEGRFIRMASVAGPMTIRFVRALNGRPHPDQFGDDIERNSDDCSST